MTTPDQTDTRWVPLKDAAEASGVSISTLRKWRSAGKIASQKRSNGRIEVDLAEVVGRAEDREPSAAPKAVVPAAEWQSIIDRIAEAEQERANAQRDLAIAEHKLSLSEAQREELQAKLGKQRWFGKVR